MHYHSIFCSAFCWLQYSLLQIYLSRSKLKVLSYIIVLKISDSFFMARDSVCPEYLQVISFCVLWIPLYLVHHGKCVLLELVKIESLFVWVKPVAKSLIFRFVIEKEQDEFCFLSVFYNALSFLSFSPKPPLLENICYHLHGYFTFILAVDIHYLPSRYGLLYKYL